MGGGGGDVQETAAQRAMADHASNLMNDYRQRWLPVQQRFAETVQATGGADSAQRKMATGKTNADVEARFGGAQDALIGGLTRSGAAPSSSKAKLAIAGMGLDKATAKGIGTTLSDDAVTGAYVQGLTALTALGRGEKAQASQGMATQAAMSGQQAQIDAQNSLSDRAGWAQLGGNAAGMGMAAAMGPKTPQAQNTEDYRGTVLPTGLRGSNNYGG